MRKMKDSGIEWIGLIPEEWETIKFKNIFNVIGGNGFPDILQGNQIGDYPFCKVSDINGENDYVDTALNWVSQSIVDKYRFNVIPKSSIIMAKIGAALSKNHRKINLINCCIDNNTQALIPKRDDNLRYLLYLTKCIDMSRFDNNSTVPSINNNKLLNFHVLDVSKAEQHRIAAYLDATCAQIDAVIEKTRASIEEYKKLKQAVITQAVTKGIRPRRKMKDSGIEWIGEIPEEWEYRKLKTFIDIPVIDGPHESPELFDSGVPYISATAIENGKINFDLMRGYISEEYCLECDKRYKPKRDDILLVKLGASTGQVAIIDTDLRFNIWVPLAAIRCNSSAYSKFIYYAFQSNYLIRQMELSWTFGTQQTLGVKTIEQLYFLLPIYNEQTQIVAYLDAKCAEIDTLIAKKQQLLAELESYKKSLIFEYVTGKKEVKC